MATKRQIEEQDRASATRRTEAVGAIIEPVRMSGHDPEAAGGVAVGVLGMLASAIEAEASDVRELRRKGWQSRDKELGAAVDVIIEWRGRLIDYAPAAGMPKHEPVDIAVSHRADTPAELDARLEAAFAIPTPGRHIRTVLEKTSHGDDQNTTYGALCGGKTGSWTHRGGANCPDCIATYDAEHGPYEGPTAFNGGNPTGAELLIAADIDPINGLNSNPDGPAGLLAEHGVNVTWKDGPVTPAVARAMREAGPATEQMSEPLQRAIAEGRVIDATKGFTLDLSGTDPNASGIDESAAARLDALPDTTGEIHPPAPAIGLPHPRMTMNDTPVSPEDAAVVVIDPFEQLRREAVERIGVVLDERVAREQAAGIDAGGAALREFVMPPPIEGMSLVEPTPFIQAAHDLKIVEPTAPVVRPRMSAAQVREHAMTRQSGSEHRSISQVEGFSDCGTRYALRDLERPAWWNVGGKALHRAVETINRNVAGMESNSLPWENVLNLETLFLRAFDAEIADQCAATPDHPMSTWRAAKRGSEHYDFWRVEGPVMVQRWVAWLTRMLADGWTIATANPPIPIQHGSEWADEPIIEFETRLNVGIAVPNLSIIDLALLHPRLPEIDQPCLLIVDMKAGASAPKDTFQLGVYGWSLLAAGIAGFTPYPDLSNVRGAYWRARTGESHPAYPASIGWPILSMHPWPDVVQRYRDMDTMERQGVYMPNVTTFCGGCGVRDLCPAQAST